MYIRVDDTVEVQTGEDRGERGKVLVVNRHTGKVLIEGINKVLKHVRRSQKNPQGGRLSKEMPVQMSNVMLVCERCSKASRFGARYLDDGSKERYCKKCGASNGEIAPARAAYAKK